MAQHRTQRAREGGYADFPRDNVVTRARQREIALVDSRDLLNVFCRFLNGEVSGDAILNAVCTEAGVVDFRNVG